MPWDIFKRHFALDAPRRAPQPPAAPADVAQSANTAVDVFEVRRQNQPAAPRVNYQGEMHLGKKHGYGTEISPYGGVKYVGLWVADKRQGFGTFTQSNGFSYVGDWHNDKKHGKGVMTWPDGNTYKGYFHEGQRHGEGKFIVPSEYTYEGMWVANKREGFGTITWSNGSVYVGEWNNDQMHGKGTATRPNGESFTGAFKHNLKQGSGKYIFANGDFYTGFWFADRLSTYGMYNYVEGHHARRDSKPSDPIIYMKLFYDKAPNCATSSAQTNQAALTALQGILQHVPEAALHERPNTNLLLRSLHRLQGPAQTYWVYSAAQKEVYCFTPQANKFANPSDFVAHTLQTTSSFVELRLTSADSDNTQEHLLFHSEAAKLRNPRQGFRLGIEALTLGLTKCWERDQQATPKTYAVCNAAMCKLSTYGTCLNGRVKSMEDILIEHGLLETDARSVLYVPQVDAAQSPQARCIAFLQAFRYYALDMMRQQALAYAALADDTLCTQDAFPTYFNTKTFKTFLLEHDFLAGAQNSNIDIDQLIAEQVALCTLGEAA